MSYYSSLSKKPETPSSKGKTSIKKILLEDAFAENAMNDPTYLRQSASLINGALKQGFDVLQMANGDIVTTITKTIATRYHWDSSKSKLIKEKPSKEENEKTDAENAAESENA